MTETHRHETFTIDRVYPNSRDEVWAAWTRPVERSQWFGIAPHEADFRVGGSESRSFFNDMGEHRNDTRYFDILDGERIVLAYAMAMNGRVHSVSLVTVTFADTEGGTRLTYGEQMCLLPPGDGAEGRRHGWGVLLDRFADYLRAGPPA
jgi:uncharacterized protein YndB with AHSA1/START domain